MNNLDEIGMQELTIDETKSINGGIILARYTEMIEAFNYVYAQFKKGIDDGYNGR